RVSGSPLAAHHAIGIDQQELDRFEVGVLFDKGAIFGLVLGGDEAGFLLDGRSRRILGRAVFSGRKAGSVGSFANGIIGSGLCPSGYFTQDIPVSLLQMI